MQASWIALVLASVALSGCADGANPSLAAPKLVLTPRDDGAVEAFVHAAFGERLYERLELQVDNETVANGTEVFSLEATIEHRAFYFNVTGETDRETYTLRGHVELQPRDEQFEVAFHDAEGTWSDPQEFGTPFERVMSLQQRAEETA